MAYIGWGREIAVNGQRPAWLEDRVRIQPTVRDMSDIGARSAFAHAWDAETTHIRLPADHFAYRALDAGFEPWGGGDAAPADWDGGKVLMRNGKTWSDSVEWQHDDDPDSDIIGYRKRDTAQPDLPPALKVGTRRVERVETITLTENEIADVLRSHFGLPEGALVVFDETGDATITLTTVDEA